MAIKKRKTVAEREDASIRVALLTAKSRLESAAGFELNDIEHERLEYFTDLLRYDKLLSIVKR